MTGAGRPNEGVSFLVGRLADETPGEPGWLEAVRVAAAAVAAGWVFWEQVAAELDGLTEEFEGLTGQAAQARFGSALDGVDDAGVLAALQTVDEEATEPRCGMCAAPVGMFLGLDGWQHLDVRVRDTRDTRARDTAVGWSRVLDTGVGHPVAGPAWPYGPAAVPVNRVGAEPAAEDFDPAGRDRVVAAGAELLGVVHDVDFHYFSDAAWTDSHSEDTAQAASQLRQLLDRLDRVVTETRDELDAVERIARVRAAHRRRSSAAEPDAGAGGDR
jgi:hypothetical protein